MSLLLSLKASRAVFANNAIPQVVSTESPLTASVTYNTNGEVTFTNGSTTWYAALITGIGDFYEIFAEDVTDPPASITGTLDAWLTISEDRTWSIQQVGVGESTAQINFKIRKVGETSVMDEGIVELIAEVVI